MSQLEYSCRQCCAEPRRTQASGRAELRCRHHDLPPHCPQAAKHDAIMVRKLLYAADAGVVDQCKFYCVIQCLDMHVLCHIHRLYPIAMQPVISISMGNLIKVNPI